MVADGNGLRYHKHTPPFPPVCLPCASSRFCCGGIFHHACARVLTRAAQAFEALYQLDLPRAVAAASKFARSGAAVVQTARSAEAAAGAEEDGGAAAAAIGMKVR